MKPPRGKAPHAQTPERARPAVSAFWRGLREPLDGAAWLLVLLPFLSLVPKFVLIARTQMGGSVVAPGFGFGGFGGYVRSLYLEGAFRSCLSPWAGCATEACHYASRMPGLPLLFAGLAKLVGTGAGAVALAKCSLLATLLAAFLYALARDARVSLRAVLLLYGLYLGPQALKHSAALDYEEGLLVDIECCLAIASAYVLKPSLSASRGRRVFMALAAVALASALYFIKATTLPILLVILALVLFRSELSRGLKAVALAFPTALFIAWGAHSYGTTGTFSISSSYDGANLYRGNNSRGLAIYPEVSLDRVFGSTPIRLDDGTLVPSSPLGLRFSRTTNAPLRQPNCSTDEWATNRFHIEQALTWIRQHPWDAARFTLRKLWVALFELRHTPYRVTPTGPDTQYPPGLRAAMALWLAFSRGTFFTLIALLIRAYRRERAPESLWALTLATAGWSPYCLVFVYQRHIIPLLLLAGFLLFALYLAKPTHISTREEREQRGREQPQ